MSRKKQNAGHPGGKGPPCEEAGHRRSSAARGPARLRSAALPRRGKKAAARPRPRTRCGHDRLRGRRTPATAGPGDRGCRDPGDEHEAVELRRGPRRTKSQLYSFATSPARIRSPSRSRPQHRGDGHGFEEPPSSSGVEHDRVGSKPVQQTSARTLARSGAVTISVNGRPQTVRIGASFPSSNPLFRLVSVSHARREDRHRQRLLLERRADRLARRRPDAHARRHGGRRPLQAAAARVVSATAGIDVRSRGAGSRRSSATRAGSG